MTAVGTCYILKNYIKGQTVMDVRFCIRDPDDEEMMPTQLKKLKSLHPLPLINH